MTVDLFARSPLLARIDKNDLAELVRGAERRSYPAGQLLFVRGDPGDGVYAIVDGRVRVFLESPDGGEVLVAMRGTGDVIGELSLLDGHRRSASATAADNVIALWISRAHFRDWLMEHPAAALVMLREITQRLRDTTDQVAEIALLDIQTRLARRLWQVFKEAARDGTPSTGSRVRVNQSELATVVGVTRESVNKHMRKLKDRGVISVESGRVVLLNPPKLEELAEVL
jgi:CRP-like cAMP-binding protein